MSKFKRGDLVSCIQTFESSEIEKGEVFKVVREHGPEVYVLTNYRHNEVLVHSDFLRSYRNGTPAPCDFTIAELQNQIEADAEMLKFYKDRYDALRVEFENYINTVGTIGYGNYTRDGSELDEAQRSVLVVRQEMDRLLNKYEPQPVIVENFAEVRATTKGDYDFQYVQGDKFEAANLKLVFTDGKLTHSEILK